MFCMPDMIVAGKCLVLITTDPPPFSNFLNLTSYFLNTSARLAQTRPSVLRTAAMTMIKCGSSPNGTPRAAQLLPLPHPLSLSPNVQRSLVGFEPASPARFITLSLNNGLLHPGASSNRIRVPHE